MSSAPSALDRQGAPSHTAGPTRALAVTGGTGGSALVWAATVERRAGRAVTQTREDDEMFVRRLTAPCYRNVPNLQDSLAGDRVPLDVAVESAVVVGEHLGELVWGNHCVRTGVLLSATTARDKAFQRVRQAF